MAAEKQLIRRTEPKNETRNPYYLHISGVYRLLKWGTLLLFTLYLVFMLVLQRDSITYENLMYLVRDLNISLEGDGAFSSVLYEEQQNMRFGAFQNELVVAGSSGIRLYDGAGECVFSDSLSYKSPVLETGDKYMLLYDAGGTEYAIFTTLACVERETASGAVQCAAMSDSGSYCVVTRSDQAKYVITLYNSAFMQVARYYRDSYVTAAAVHPNGRTLAVLSTATDDWSLASEVTFYSASSEERSSVSLGTSLPVAARYLENGTLAVICDDAVVYLNEAGVQINRVPLSSMTLTYFSVSENKVALVCRENILGSSSRILVLDSTGAALCDVTRSKKVIGITASSGRNSAYILYSDAVETISIAGGETVPYTKQLHAIREIAGRAVLCFADKAQALDSGGEIGGGNS